MARCLLPHRRTLHGADRRDRSAFTLVELLIALSITSMVSLGIASMLTMVGSTTSEDRESRSMLLRAHAAQARLRAYIAPALSVLSDDPAQGLAIWLQDDRPVNNVHLSELRVIWWDAAAGTLTLERLQFPPEWSQLLRDAYDAVLPAGTDYFTEMLTQRAAGFTAQETLVEGLSAFSAAYSQLTPAASERVTLTLVFRDASGVDHEALLAFGLPGHVTP